MKVFLCSFLGLVLLCSSVYARFAHSKQYLEKLAQEQGNRNRFTMEQSWEKRISHARINCNSGTSQRCEVVIPRPKFGTEVNAVSVCKIDEKVCHHSQLFECCEEDLLSGEANAVAGGACVDVGSENDVTVSFFYAGGGYGSRQPLSLCYTIRGSDEICDKKVFGCNSDSSCRPCNDICENNIMEGTNCNPDPNPDNGGGCTCQTGYLAPNCCLCDSPDFHESETKNGEFTCEPTCRENCVGAPTRLGCSNQCEEGYQGRGCCECAPEYITISGKCVPACEITCVTGKFNPVTGCSECLPGYQAPTCCECAPGYITISGKCVPVCDGKCIGTFDPENGCGQCQLGYAPPTCCDCQPPFIEVGTECRPSCRTNCQEGFFTDGIGCAADRCRTGYQAPPLCCNCTDNFMQPSLDAPCTRIPITCKEDERLENGECVRIYCEDDEVYDPETGKCISCGGKEDLVFLLDYSTSFQPQELRGIIGNLQLISNAIDSHPNIRDAAIHYNIHASRISPMRFTPSDYIYDYNATCKDTVDQLDNFAENRNIDNNRSFTTESYSALNFVAREVPFTAGRRTSIVTITDGFSDASDRISRIETEISNIKVKASAANATVRFFSIGVKGQTVSNITIIQEELKALADGVDRENNYIDYEQFTNNLLNLLVDANILCPADRESISATLNGAALRNYIACTRRESSCATSNFNFTCSNAETMSRDETRKSSLMAEILAAVKSVFNDAFKTE